jgi:hypothetical protein
MARLIDDLPIVFVWATDGKEYRGTRGAVVTSKRQVEGGVLEEPDLQITIALKKLIGGRLVNTFPSSAIPEPDQKFLHVAGRTNYNFRIERVIADEYGAAIQCDLMTAADATDQQSDYVQGGNFSGAGSPEGVISARVGARYLETDTGDWWEKKTGERTNTGWVEMID